MHRLKERGGKKSEGKSQGVLTIYMGKPEIPVGRSNGSRHPIWEASENMGCDLRKYYYPLLRSLSS